MKKEDNEWMKIYKEAKKYYDINGNLKVPYDYNVIIDDQSICLGCWLDKQRRKYKGITKVGLSNEQIKLLEDIKMVWDKKEYVNNDKKDTLDNWMKMYEYAKKYYEKYGDLLIPQTYYLIDNNEVINLGIWIRTQRNNYKKTSKSRLSDKQIKLLEDIKMVWDGKEYANRHKCLLDDWMKMYGYAKKYYEKNGDLLVSQSYYLIDNNEVINLGEWIKAQRSKYNDNSGSKLSNEQIRLLEDIKMVWDVIFYKRLDKYLKYQYELYEKNELDYDKLNKLIRKEIFVYTDDNKLEVNNTFYVYKKYYINK